MTTTWIDRETPLLLLLRRLGVETGRGTSDPESQTRRKGPLVVVPSVVVVVLVVVVASTRDE